MLTDWVSIVAAKQRPVFLIGYIAEFIKTERRLLQWVCVPLPYESQFLIENAETIIKLGL